MTRPELRPIVVWLGILLLASLPAMRVGEVLRGGSDGVPGSESIAAVDQAVAAGVPAGTFYPFIALLHSDVHVVTEAQFGEAGRALITALEEPGGATAVQSVWDTNDLSLVGRSGHAALLLIHPDVGSFSEAELATARLRDAIASVSLPAGFHCELTGQPAVLYDLNRRSSADLMGAERIGIPLMLLILLLVFRSPVAALLPIALAISATTLSLAALYLLSGFTVVSVFAENTVTMIGLGVGVDYALFLVAAFRRALATGETAQYAARSAVREVRGTILCSGAAAAIGFLALCLVRLPFLKALAFGGVAVVLSAVIATLTLLPAVLSLLGPRVNWPRARARASDASPFWAHWAQVVMRRPVIWAGLALAVLALFVLPVFRMSGWNFGAAALDGDLESRQGYELLRGEFAPGWIGPAAAVLEAQSGRTLDDDSSRNAVRQWAEHLKLDPRIVLVRGPAFQGRIALIALIGRSPPESKEAAALVRDLRAETPAALLDAGLTLRITGAAAMLADFDREIFSKLWVVVPAVLAVSFLLLFAHLRSVLIPLKAIVLNLLSVLASYGFLILVFQDGHGAGLIGLTPPGGLNAFIVLVLFTILFGLSMDYEVFLLASIRAEYLRSGNNAEAVARGIARTGGLITSAAAIMVSLFLAFGFTRLIATREFGLGLAFAVALDATLIRLVLLPALMTLLGRANWWLPVARARARVVAQ